MVVATKYLLKVPKSVKEGTWDKNGYKEEIHTKIIPRAFVNERNSHDNNELYIIDEEATDKMMETREKNILAKAEKNKREAVSTADLVDAIAGRVAPVENPVNIVTGNNGPVEGAIVPGKLKRFEDMDEKELRQYSLNNSIKQHPKAGAKKMVEVINAHNSNK